MDAAGNSSTANQSVIVRDTTQPVIAVVANPFKLSSMTAPVTVNFAGNLSVSDAVSTNITPVCSPASGTQFGWGSTTVSCTATDSSGNVSAAKTFSVVVQFPYDVTLIVPKGKVRAGSTIPIDWYYQDRVTGARIDSSAFPVAVLWRQYMDNNCSTSPGSVSGSDSGNSSTRYSSSSSTWQFSWQTPNITGNFVVTVAPPGTNDGSNTDSSECVVLR